VAFAALEIIVPWGLLSAAERKLPSSLAGLLIAAVPIISVVTARLTGGTERLSGRRWAGLVIGLGGVAALAAPDLGGGGGLPLAAPGVICTACAFLVFLALIREAGTSRAMVFTYVNPAVAVAAGVAFLSEPFTVTIAVSFALILAGSLLATWTGRGGRGGPAGPAHLADLADPEGQPAVRRRRPPRPR